VAVPVRLMVMALPERVLMPFISKIEVPPTRVPPL
jgi:hypothetical protein